MKYIVIEKKKFLWLFLFYWLLKNIALLLLIPPFNFIKSEPLQFYFILLKTPDIQKNVPNHIKNINENFKNILINSNYNKSLLNSIDFESLTLYKKLGSIIKYPITFLKLSPLYFWLCGKIPIFLTNLYINYYILKFINIFIGILIIFTFYHSSKLYFHNKNEAIVLSLTFLVTLPQFSILANSVNSYILTMLLFNLFFLISINFLLSFKYKFFYLFLLFLILIISFFTSPFWLVFLYILFISLLISIKLRRKYKKSRPGNFLIFFVLIEYILIIIFMVIVWNHTDFYRFKILNLKKLLIELKNEKVIYDLKFNLKELANFSYHFFDKFYTNLSWLEIHTPVFFLKIWIAIILTSILGHMIRKYSLKMWLKEDESKILIRKLIFYSILIIILFDILLYQNFSTLDISLTMTFALVLIAIFISEGISNINIPIIKNYLIILFMLVLFFLDFYLFTFNVIPHLFFKG